MRIAIINLVRRGGMLHYHSQLAIALSKQADSEAVIADVVDPSIYDGTPCMRVNIGKDIKDTIRMFLWPPTWWRMYKTFGGLSHDVVHVTSSHVQNVYILLFCRQPLAYTIHDIYPHEGERWYTIQMDKLMRRRATLLFVHNPEAKKILEDSGCKAKVAVISQGDYSFMARWADDSIKAEQSLLFFGRIEEYKGLEYLLKAMPAVWEQHPSCNLVIAGSGDMSPYKDLFGDERIEVHNRFIPDEEVASFFQKTSLVVLPYISATQSGVIPIASAFAKPVIATRVGSLAEAIMDGQTGVLVPSKDVEALVIAINEEIANPDKLQAQGLAAKKYMDEYLGWDAIARTHIEAYKLLVGA